MEPVALPVHGGIEGYRDEGLDAYRELTADRDLRHEVLTYEDEFDVRMDDEVESDPMDMLACVYCGVFRRDIIASYAEDLGADKLLTGHNLDDEAETALMNFLGGNIRKISRQFDASLGPFEGGDEAVTRNDSARFVARAVTP